MNGAASTGGGTATGPGKPLPAYFDQVDALRLLAVVVVMLHHYLPGVEFALFGKGVILFFFLSGYFATRQLLRTKDLLATGGRSIRTGLKVFYLRRYIRILPVYLAIVIASALAGLPYAREALPWLLTFTTNWYILIKQDWIGPFSPFWSLGLLEQFYLFWPALLLALPRRREIPAALTLVGIAIAWRLWCLASQQSVFTWFLLPWAGYDQLGLGALAAIVQAREAESPRLLHGLKRAGLLLAGPASLVLILIARFGDFGGVFYVWEPALNCLFFIWLLDTTSRGHVGLAGRLMSLPTVCALGRSSYSIFALHEFTVFLIPPALRDLLEPVLAGHWRWTILLPCTLMVAWLSYRYVETPVSRLKRHFRV